jgi:branched-chain amino acid transport system permease protein
VLAQLLNVLAQLLNGLASASSLFLLSVGLTLIFGVSRVVNFAHGSLAMLGLYVGITLSAPLMSTLGPVAGFWLAVVAAAVAVGAGGALVERTLLRRLYGAAELFQLLATFALVLIVRDATLAIWGADDLLGPRAPGLAGMVGFGGFELPAYDFALMGIGVVVLIALQTLLTRSRWGLRVRAATEDREMAQALGLDERRLYTQVFALGAALAGLAGALQMPQQPATLSYDLNVVVEAFVVTIIGGMGSVPGAFIAAMAIGAIKALCIAMGTVSVLGLDIAWPKLTLVIEFLLMAVVLAFRPWGLFGRAVAAARAVRVELSPLAAPRRRDDLIVLLIVALLAALPLLAKSQPYVLVLAIDVLISAVFAASLHALMGPAGIASFGHAAYLGLGAYGAALSAP